MKTNPLAPALSILEDVRQQCLFIDDDGTVGVTTEPHISDELFAKICAVLAPSAKEDGIPEEPTCQHGFFECTACDFHGQAEPIAGCEYVAKTGATLIPRLVDHNKSIVMYTNSNTGGLHGVSMKTWDTLLKPVASLQEPEGELLCDRCEFERTGNYPPGSEFSSHTCKAEITDVEIERKWYEINQNDGDIRVMAMLHELLNRRRQLRKLRSQESK